MLPINVNLPLREVTDRMRSCRAVQWAIETYGTRLVDDLGESFGPFLAEGQVMPFAVQLELFVKMLNRDFDRLVATDRAYRDQKARESVSRGRRETQADNVNKDVIDLRDALKGFYSDDKLAELGFARRTPTVPVELLEQTSHLVERLNDPELDPSGVSFGDVQLDVANLATELTGSVETFKQDSEALGREVRRTEASKLAKDDAVDRYNTSFLWIARTVESLCRLAGLDEVARRVRPSQRRPGVTARKFEEPEGSQPNGSAEDGKPEGDGSTEPAPEAAESEAPQTSE
ncbi:MAG: hypothetical protein GY719_00200 [bacterium]|nr:hypothetical protein [bacterium]